MTSPPPELFYTGIVAQAYAALRSAAPDPRIYQRFVKMTGEPALEIGCGDGDPLLDLVAAGLDVEGLDSSPDMLARCRSAADARGLRVVLHEQPMQSMQLERRFRSIYLAGPTFNLLPDDDVAQMALQRIAAHLAPSCATRSKLTASRQPTSGRGCCTGTPKPASPRSPQPLVSPAPPSSPPTAVPPTPRLRRSPSYSLRPPLGSRLPRAPSARA